MIKKWYKNWKIWLLIIIIFGFIGSFVDDKNETPPPAQQTTEPKTSEVPANTSTTEDKAAADKLMKEAEVEIKAKLQELGEPNTLPQIVSIEKSNPIQLNIDLDYRDDNDDKAIKIIKALKPMYEKYKVTRITITNKNGMITCLPNESTNITKTNNGGTATISKL